MSMWPPVRSTPPPAQERAEIPRVGDQKEQEKLQLNQADFLGECVIGTAIIVLLFFFFFALICSSHPKRCITGVAVK